MPRPLKTWSLVGPFFAFLKTSGLFGGPLLSSERNVLWWSFCSGPVDYGVIVLFFETD